MQATLQPSARHGPRAIHARATSDYQLVGDNAVQDHELIWRSAPYQCRMNSTHNV